MAKEKEKRIIRRFTFFLILFFILILNTFNIIHDDVSARQIEVRDVTVQADEYTMPGKYQVSSIVDIPAYMGWPSGRMIGDISYEWCVAGALLWLWDLLNGGASPDMVFELYSPSGSIIAWEKTENVEVTPGILRFYISCPDPMFKVPFNSVWDGPGTYRIEWHAYKDIWVLPEDNIHLGTWYFTVVGGGGVMNYLTAPAWFTFTGWDFFPIIAENKGAFSFKIPYFLMIILIPIWIILIRVIYGLWKNSLKVGVRAVRGKKKIKKPQEVVVVNGGRIG